MRFKSDLLFLSADPSAPSHTHINTFALLAGTLLVPDSLFATSKCDWYPTSLKGYPSCLTTQQHPLPQKPTFHNCVFKHNEFLRKTISVDEGHQRIYILDYKLVYLASKSFKSCLSFNLLEIISVWCSYWPGHRFDFGPLPVLGCRYLRWAGRYNVSISPQLRCHTPKLGSSCQSRPTPMDSTGSMQEGEEREI